MTDFCPCGSGLALARCCGRYHDGEPAPSPGALMRSRFSAFALQDTDYLLQTWHPETRPAEWSADGRTRWQRLEVLDSGEESDRGFVHFRATWRAGADWGVLEERSCFLRQDGRWLYHGGEVVTRALTPGRNDPCPCGSGRKFKRCCRL